MSGSIGAGPVLHFEESRGDKQCNVVTARTLERWTVGPQRTAAPVDLMSLIARPSVPTSVLEAYRLKLTTSVGSESA